VPGFPQDGSAAGAGKARDCNRTSDLTDLRFERLQTREYKTGSPEKRQSAAIAALRAAVLTLFGGLRSDPTKWRHAGSAETMAPGQERISPMSPPPTPAPGMTRRDLLGMVGTVAGSVAMYQAMTAMGFAQESPYSGPIRLEGDPRGARVLVLGAGLAGMTAALELRNAGYQVEILEYREKAGGRCWTLHSGDTYTELGGEPQTVGFAEGNYLNPGPWRIPHHHHAVIDYCRRLGVQLEVFVQENHNAYLHRQEAFDGQPQRFRHINTDYRGHVAELLAKVVDQGALDAEVTEDDKHNLLDSLREFGVLNEAMEYVSRDATSEFRGWEKPPGGGVDAAPVPSDPIPLDALLESGLWRWLVEADTITHQGTMFQPVGGMDRIAVGFEREVGDLITYNAKVVSMQQSDDGVTVEYEDLSNGGSRQSRTADWCVCTIPFSILGQIDHNLSAEKAQVVNSMHYAGSIKFGLEFNRRFWEEDEHIFGGISYTDLPISMISYPSNGYLGSGKAVLLGGYVWGANAYQFNAMPSDERVRLAVEYGAQIHPQYTDEFDNGISVSWHRVPWVLGCYGIWADKDRDYAAAVEMDARIVLAGEHLSYLPAWQEGAILSALDAISRLHGRVMETAGNAPETGADQ
jgi:monoamine oxidase